MHGQGEKHYRDYCILLILLVNFSCLSYLSSSVNFSLVLIHLPVSLSLSISLSLSPPPALSGQTLLGIVHILIVVYWPFYMKGNDNRVSRSMSRLLDYLMTVYPTT